LFVVQKSHFAALAAVLALLGTAACTRDPGTAPFNDPYEAQNRVVHKLNSDVDRLVLRPTSQAYDSGLPKPVQQGISNFSDNFETPGMMVNNLLQGDVEHLVENTFRFVINTTFGIGGVMDAADAIGMGSSSTDFGETLHVWGVQEGAYLELPFYGPSTERDAAGLVVDLALNPLGFVLPKPEKYLGTITKLASRVGDRGRYSDTVDSILYESADSYAQARILYLQNRRFELGQEAATDTFDPYEDPYGQ
jgi:phospholipid-binding lipoprotein MlaA